MYCLTCDLTWSDLFANLKTPASLFVSASMHNLQHIFPRIIKKEKSVQILRKKGVQFNSIRQIIWTFKTHFLSSWHSYLFANLKTPVSLFLICFNAHCYHVNDFPLVNGTPGIIQDPIDLLLAKCNSDIGIGFQCLQYLCQNWVNCTLPNSDIGIGFQYLQYCLPFIG